MRSRFIVLGIGILMIIIGSVATFLKYPYFGNGLILIGTIVGLGAVFFWKQKARK
ncbi:hypothetical protein [Paenibacillus thermotolerans]|uniref:hypothetical protein n=1 Tax=Paenibacillus thermotolerans TaxID=3027807 RepID=UPI002368902C|nr:MULTISPECIES: hypothetical protein [unclassified Paenibacillus]